MPLGTTYRESGHGPGDQLISLAGVIGKPGIGREVVDNAQAVTTALAQYIASNDRRIALLIYNPSANQIYFSFNNGSTGIITCYPRDSILINKDFPWTGPISAYSIAGGDIFTWIEVSVP